MKPTFFLCSIAIALCFSVPALASERCVWNVSREPRLQELEDGSLRMTVSNPALPGYRPLDWPYRWLPGLTGVTAISRFYRNFVDDNRPGADFYDRLVRSMSVNVEVDGVRLDAIPRTGPLIVVVNHPLVGLEVVSVAREIARFRGAADVRMVLTDLFRDIPAFEPHSFFLDVHSGATSNPSARPLLRWLRAGRVIVLCPAGEVAFRNSDGITRDRPWARAVVGLAQASGATVVPIFAHGELSSPFHRLRRWNYDYAAYLMMRELSLLEGTTVRLNVGRPLSPEELRDADRADLAAYLRAYVYALAGDVVSTRRIGGALPAPRRSLGFGLARPGIVTIPGTYRDTSRQLLIAYLARHHGAADVSRPQFRTPLVAEDVERLVARRDLAALSRLVQDIEPDGRGVPPAIAALVERNAVFTSFQHNETSGDVEISY